MKKTEKEIVEAAAQRLPTSAEQSAFEEVLAFIEQSRVQASQAVNTVLIDLYWKVGEYVWHKIKGGARERCLPSPPLCKANTWESVDSRHRTSGGCASFLMPTATSQISHRC